MRRFDQILGERSEKVAQQENRERQSKGGVYNPDGPVLAGKADVREYRKNRFQRNLVWNDQHRHDEEKEEVTERKFHPGEGVGRECANRHRQERSRYGNDQAIQKVLPKSLPL